MSTLRKTLTAAAAAALLVAGPALAEGPDKVVTVVSAEHPQTQLAAMVLSTQALEQGKEVRMLLCGPAGDLGLAEAPESATAPQPPHDASPQGMMQAMMERGVQVQVCAIYLPGLGADASVLLEGVTVAQPPEMAGAMLGGNTVVWSF